MYKNNGFQIVRLHQLSHAILIWIVAFKLANKLTIIEKKILNLYTNGGLCLNRKYTLV